MATNKSATVESRTSQQRPHVVVFWFKSMSEERTYKIERRVTRKIKFHQSDQANHASTPIFLFSRFNLQTVRCTPNQHQLGVGGFMWESYSIDWLKSSQVHATKRLVGAM